MQPAVVAAALACALSPTSLFAQFRPSTLPSTVDVAPAGSDVASTQPLLSTQMVAPAPSVPASAVQLALEDLNSRDAARQNAARVLLMGLPRAQLPTLRDDLQRYPSISPAMAAALHEIVLHDFLVEEPYACKPAGFLGLRWSPLPTMDEPTRLGVPVDIRLPGCPSYRFLQRGDLILGVLRPDPQQPTTPGRLFPTPEIGSLQTAIQGAGCSQPIELAVLREGERIRVALTLFPMPDEDAKSDAAFDRRRERGEAFWRETFLPLLKPGLL